VKSRLPTRIAAIALMATLGCAAMQKSDTMKHERSLAAAGFQMRFADSPDRLTQIQALPQGKLVSVPFEGERRWVYADAEYCKCMYVGTEMAYDRYQRIAIRQQLAEERLEASSMDWGGWGGWGPWY
jgi:hypothetical protein